MGLVSFAEQALARGLAAQADPIPPTSNPVEHIQASTPQAEPHTAPMPAEPPEVGAADSIAPHGIPQESGPFLSNASSATTQQVTAIL